jgi:hypothetical protein
VQRKWEFPGWALKIASFVTIQIGMLKIACPDWQFGVLVAIYSAFGSV